MGTVRLEKRQYETYVLSDSEPDSIVEVVPERGGIVTRWQFRGQEVFYMDTERFTHPDLTVRGGNPILFPICGNLIDNTYTHNGQSYTLKQHGFGREMAWSVIGQQEDYPGLTVGLTSTEQTRAVYPFDFQLEFSYSLRGNTLATHQRVINQSDEPMPFAIGFHPYFSVSDKTQLQFDIPGTEFYDQRSKTTQSFQGNFDVEQDEIDAAFKNVSRQSATVVDRERSLRLVLDYSQEFSTLVFWTVKSKPFYCLEPWTSPRNALVTGENLIRLAPGASLDTDFNLTVSQI